MRIRNATAAILCATGLLFGNGVRAETLWIRLVKASNAAEETDSRLADVLPALAKSLVFKSYSLVAATTIELPASGREVRLGVYSITCQGPARNLSIQIRHEDTPLLYTTVSLQEGKPVLLGGFPATDGRMILVFVLQR